MSIAESGTERNQQVHPLDALATLDLVEYGRQYHHDQYIAYSRLARWHKRHRSALAAERYYLSQEVSAALAEAQEVLR